MTQTARQRAAAMLQQGVKLWDIAARLHVNLNWLHGVRKAMLANGTLSARSGGHGWDESQVPEREPSEPCCAVPGSLERKATLKARLERGELLWHPRDRRDYGDAR